MIAARFARNLAIGRERAGLTQEELAFRADLHRTEIGLLERGERVPRLDTVLKLAGALGMEPVGLLDGIRWSPAEQRPGEFTTREGKG